MMGNAYTDGTVAAMLEQKRKDDEARATQDQQVGDAKRKTEAAALTSTNLKATTEANRQRDEQQKVRRMNAGTASPGIRSTILTSPLGLAGDSQNTGGASKSLLGY